MGPDDGLRRERASGHARDGLGLRVATVGLPLLLGILAGWGLGQQSPRAAPSAAATGAVGPHRVCDGTREPALEAGAWVHKRSHLVRRAGGPAHALRDLLVPSGAAGTLEAKLAYGVLSKDLEDEAADAFVDVCGGWLPLQTVRSDGDGRARWALAGGLLEGPGTYRALARVVGDGSRAWGYVRVLPKATQLAVFDIDGTLTTSDAELIKDVTSDLFRPLSSGERQAKARPGAIAVTQRVAELGYEIVYMTGRPYWLDGVTRTWLRRQGCPPGHLVLAPSNAAAKPDQEGVGQYKKDTLVDLQRLGFTVSLAFGNAATDIWAYQQAGLAPGKTFIAGPLGGQGGTVGVGEGYEELLAKDPSPLPPAVQPFQR